MPRLLTVLLLAAGLACAEPANLLPGGSFEGTLAWWIPRTTPCAAVEVPDAPEGRFVLRTTGKGFIHSQPLLLEGGKTYTVSGWARSATGAGTLALTIHPTPRQAGLPPFAIGRGGKVARPWVNPTLGREWRHFSCSIPLPDYAKEKHDFPSPWWWDFKSWWLFLQGPDTGWEVDGLAITAGPQAPAAYVPRSRIEVGVEIRNLPGFRPAANLFPIGATAALAAGLRNPGPEPFAGQLAWELCDYEGLRVLEQERAPLRLAAGETRVAEKVWSLPARGLVLLRARVLAADGAEVGACQAPATVLPFPKAATVHDPAERFGGTYVAGQPAQSHLTPVAQRLGLAWTRWYPQLNWKTVQKEGPADWLFPEALVQEQLAHGIGQNVVLYALPEWAKGRHPNLPQDMQDWAAADPRWDDLSLETAWDRYLKGMVAKYRGPSFVWEVVNEPQFGKWDGALYLRFVQRSAKVLKAADPGAKVMINSVNGFDGITKDFARRGGSAAIDILSFHNYNNGAFASAESIRSMRRAFRRADGSEPEVWFNEGWTWTPSSRSAAAPGMRSDRPPAEAVHTFVRAHADTFSAGMRKMIYFNLAYPGHGRSWWDWAGDGTEIWDDHDEPTVAVPALNVLVHHLGLSDAVAAVRHEKAWLHVFHDRRNRRGVCVAWATEAGLVLDLPVAGLVAGDVMGGAEAVEAQPGATRIAFARPGRPVYLWKDGLDGEGLGRALRPLAAPAMSAEQGVSTVPRDWMDREAAGNPYLVEGKPLWTLARVLGPVDRHGSYIALRKWQPEHSNWGDTEQSQGGQPAGGVDADGRVNLATRGALKDGKVPALIFHAPADGTYHLTGRATFSRWEGSAKGLLLVNLLNSEQGEVQELARVVLEKPRGEWSDCAVEAIELRQGQRLALVFGLSGGGGANCQLDQVRLQRR